MSEVRLALILGEAADPFQHALEIHSAVTTPWIASDVPSPEFLAHPELLADVDGVYVAAGVERRIEAIVAAGRAGRAVLAPGLLARTVAEVDEIAERLGSASSLVFAPFPLRFNPTSTTVERGLKQGGTLRVITAALRARPRRGLDWRDLLADLGDYVLSLTGFPADRVHATAITPSAAESPIGVVVLAALPGDVLADLECGITLPETYPRGQAAEIELLTSESVITLDPENQAFAAYGASGGDRRVSWSQTPAVAIVDVFVHALQGQSNLMAGLEAQREVIQFIAQVDQALAGATRPVA